MKRILSLFTGVGGMDLGFLGGFSLPLALVKMLEKEVLFESDTVLTLNPFEIVYANDINKYAKTAYENYFASDEKLVDYYELGSIIDKLKEVVSGNDTFPENIDIIIGGFPCQDFSLAGKRLGFDSTKNHLGINDLEKLPENRGNLYLAMKSVIQITKPKMFVAENVKGLFLHKENLEKIRYSFENINGGEYLIVAPKLLNTYHFGVPQNRERVFIFGFRRVDLNEEAFQMLSKNVIDEAFDPYPKPISNFSVINAGLILADLPEPEFSAEISQKYYSKARFLNNKSQGQIEINLAKPSPTIRAEHHGNIEFRRLSKENGGGNIYELELGKLERRLSVRECARLQTFPDDFEFVRLDKGNIGRFEVSPSEAYKIIGNAVPPLMAYHIAKNIADKWGVWFK